jgi:hypothetical protein
MVKVYDELLRRHRMMEEVAKQLKPCSLFEEVQRHTGIIKAVREQEELLKVTGRIGRKHWERERALSRLASTQLLGNPDGIIARAAAAHRLDEETRRIFSPLSSRGLSSIAAKAAELVEPHKRFADHLAWQDSLAVRMAKLDFAWAAPDFPDKSAYAFGSLARMNDMVAFDRPFSSNTRKHVEAKLGAVVEIYETDDIEDLEGRYDKAGRDAALVAFPDPQYSIILRAAGFELSISAPPTPQPIANATGPAHYDDEHHAVLRNLELHLRHFISTQLQKHVGRNWMKERIPGNLRLRWEERQSEAYAAGQPIYDLIHYADFNDLSVLIGRKDNWSQIFEAVFQDREGVQVSLKRLAPLRNGDAHHRPFCSTEILYLAAESTRLLNAIGVVNL